MAEKTEPTPGIPKMRLGDLQRTMTVEQALEMATAVAEAAREHIDATIEHWTDDEGLHWLPFDRDLNKKLPASVEEASLAYLTSHGII